MIKVNMTSLGAIALALGGLAVTTAADAPDRAASASMKAAKKAAKALNAHRGEAAVAAAEEAVTLAPHDAAYRMLLGQSYLQAGRFKSAAQAFTDTLQLDSTNGKAALNLALAQIATGDWQLARGTLMAHDEITASDRGLALALAGDTQSAIAMLMQVARSPAANAKVRQNLALSYALAGQWQLARVVAETDLSPADLDARMQEWAAFAQPSSASTQVASMLGVQPVQDLGQPTALALNTADPIAPATAVAAASAPASAPLVSVAVPAAQPFTAGAPRITFAAAHEVVQPLPAALIRAGGAPIKVRAQVAAASPAHGRRPVANPAVVKAAPESGSWYVQLGAYDSVGVAKDGWARATRRFAAFGGHQPNGMTFKVGATSFYRLSVGGFNRAEADKACRAYRARGGSCFVRAGAGDQMAAWMKGGTQVAMK